MYATILRSWDFHLSKNVDVINSLSIPRQIKYINRSTAWMLFLWYSSNKALQYKAKTQTVSGEFGLSTLRN